MDTFSLVDTVPLSYTRVLNGALVTGLTVSVSVTNTQTGATLLPSTPCPETPSGSGLYGYRWVHGLTQDTQCLVTYTVNGRKYPEYIFITNAAGGDRSV